MTFVRSNNDSPKTTKVMDSKKQSPEKVKSKFLKFLFYLNDVVEQIMKKMMTEMKRVISRQNAQLDLFKEEIRQLTLGTAIHQMTKNQSQGNPKYVGASIKRAEDSFNDR